MVFPSVPVYLDHPNWHQLQHPNPQEGSGTGSPGQLQPTPPPPPQVGGGGGSIRPGSMVDRARLAKLPLPEAGLKCPRCDSTNTKFCYFNNYSLTQPRHFCKACRRYWTRGGALRNVPVGGGCRRNKRSKNSSSKSAANTERQAGSNSTGASPSSCSAEMAAHFPQSSPQLPFIGDSLQNLSQFGGLNIGSSLGGIQSQMVAAGGSGHSEIGFNLGLSSGGGADQWRLPFFGGFEAPANFFPYQSEGVEASVPMVEDSQLRSTSTSSVVSQVVPVKSEGNQQDLNLSTQFLGISDNNSYWATNAWTGFSGLNSSSASHLL